MHLLSLRSDLAVLCCICVRSLISAGVCCLVGGSVSERSQESRSFYGVTLLLSSFQLFPSSTAGVSSFCPLVGCKYLHLTLSTACWASQRAAMLGSCLQSHHSISKSQALEPPLELDPNLGWLLGHLFLRLFSIFVPAVPSDRNNSGSEVLTMGQQPHPST